MKFVEFFSANWGVKLCHGGEEGIRRQVGSNLLIRGRQNSVWYGIGYISENIELNCWSQLYICA